MIFAKTVILKILEIFQNTGKIQVFRGTRNFWKLNLAKIQKKKTRTHFFSQFSLKGAAHSVSLGLRQLLLRRAVLGGGLPPEIAADINQSARSSHPPAPRHISLARTRGGEHHTPQRKKLTTTRGEPATPMVSWRPMFQEHNMSMGKLEFRRRWTPNNGNAGIIDVHNSEEGQQNTHTHTHSMFAAAADIWINTTVWKAGQQAPPFRCLVSLRLDTRAVLLFWRICVDDPEPRDRATQIRLMPINRRNVLLRCAAAR